MWRQSEILDSSLERLSIYVAILLFLSLATLSLNRTSSC
jgi:hypothetical protein